MRRFLFFILKIGQDRIFSPRIRADYTQEMGCCHWRFWYHIQVKLSLKPTPQFAGKFTMIGTVWFWLSLVILGLIQPGYQPARDTISILVVGKYGWIQQLNFWVLAMTVLIFGLGLSRAFYGRRWSSVSSLFGILSFGIIDLIIFPADPRDATQTALRAFHSIQGLMHISTVALMGLIMIGLAVVVYRQLAKKPDWHQLQKVTFWLMSFGIIFGIFWMYCRYNGIFFLWKGLIQKIIVTDVLIWLWLMGRKLASLPEKNS